MNKIKVKVYTDEELDSLLENWDQWNESEDEVEDLEEDDSNDGSIPGASIPVVCDIDIPLLLQNNGKCSV